MVCTGNRTGSTICPWCQGERNGRGHWIEQFGFETPVRGGNQCPAEHKWYRQPPESGGSAKPFWVPALYAGVLWRARAQTQASGEKTETNPKDHKTRFLPISTGLFRITWKGLILQFYSSNIVTSQIDICDFSDNSRSVKDGRNGPCFPPLDSDFLH